ncbi:MAG: hypothetical protein HZA50_16630 [Planctomycetes bacterium]|nr:hypothetical protein [Planctomycetota bacterium]
MNKKEFANPGGEYRGVTLWMLNDRLEKAEIARQLQGFRRAGWGAVITRTFAGLLTKYLSDEWMEILGEIVRVARREGIKVWFQAGYMPSGVPDLRPEMAHKVIVCKPAREAGEGKKLHADPNYAYYAETRPNVVDFLSRDAVREYLKIAYDEPWVRRFGKEFGRTVEAIWVDEPHFNPPLLPWNDALPGRFGRRWGYPLLPKLNALFSATGDFMKIRHHYWRTVLEMLLEGYFAGVRDWCDRHGVRFAGHLMCEDTIQSQIGWTAAVMPCYEYMHLPGIDHLTMSLTWPSGKPFIMTPKQCSSAANQLGRRDVLAEMYGVSSQGITFEDRKRLGERFAVLGINYRCYHGSFYSMRGRRKRTYVPHLSHQQPWWTDNRQISDPFARLSWSLRQGTFDADVLVIHPVESGFCLYDPAGMQRPLDQEREPREIRALNDAIVDLSENLLTVHRGFEYGDETILARHGKVKGNRLVVGKMSYRAVVLPSLITLRGSTVDLLLRFAAVGGAILSAGRLPDRIDGVPDGRLKKLIRAVHSVPNSTAAIRDALDERIPAEMDILPGGQGDPANVWVHCRRLDGGRAYFCVNTSRDAAVAARVWIRGTGRMEIWDLRTGRIKALPQHREKDGIVGRLFFAPSESRLLVFHDGAAASDVPESPRRILRSFALPDGWQLRRSSPNALTLDWCRFRRGSEEWSEFLPVICVNEILQQEQYDGPVSLEFRFRAEDKPKQLRLAAEDAAEWEIRVNGNQVQYDGLPYYLDSAFGQVEITRQAIKGENIIVMSRRFQHLQQPRFGLSSLFDCLPGTELESVYLVGDFAVRGYPSDNEQRPRCVRYCPGFSLKKEPQWTEGDLIQDGYPFFAGHISLAGTVRIEAPKKGEKAIFALPRLDAAVAHVRVNGKPAGAISWSPYELDVTKLVRQGENRVEIELVNTLRNLLGPHHRIKGETDSAWGHEFTFYPDWLAKPWDRRANWTDDYFFLPLGLQEGAKILIICGNS